MLKLRRFNLWAWATYTGPQKVAMLLRGMPPKLDRQHEKTWVLLTSPACTHHIYSIQSYYHLVRPPVPTSSSLSATTSLSLPPDGTHCEVCQSSFFEHKMLLCDICNAGWHMNCLLPPLITISIGTWKCPHVHLATPSPRQQHDTFASPPPFSILTPTKKNENI